MTQTSERPKTTVAALIAQLQTLPPDAEVIGAACRSVKVIPQTTGAILVVD